MMLPTPAILADAAVGVVRGLGGSCGGVAVS